MASTNDLLAATLGLQANAQANLPVIPNNGNPGGAHNMPHQEQGAAPAAPSYPYPWMAPSPYMDNIKRRITGMQQNLGQTAQPAQQMAPPPVAAPQQGLPIIPQNVLT